MSFQRMPVDYCLDRSLPEMEKWMADLGYTPDMPLAVDIETPETDKINEEDSDDPEKTSYTIIRCGFSFRHGTAASYPWVEPFITFTRNLLCAAHTVILHNGGFDRPRLERAGCQITGRVYDTMWCLNYDTQVKLSDGSYKKIGEVVENKLDVELLTYERGCIVPTRIVAYHANAVLGQRWVKIHAQGTRFPIFCTPDHKIYTMSGWVEAKDIVVGDQVPLPHYGSEWLIHGTILGDAWVSPNGDLRLLHSTIQRDWINAKARHMHANVYESKAPTGKGTNPNLYASISVPCQWRSLFYPDGKKVFIPPPHIASIAVWYGDDGNWHQNNDNNLGAPRFCIAGFSATNKAAIRDWLAQEFDGARLQQKDTIVAINTKRGRIKFFEAIAPWMHPSMERKLPKCFRGYYNGWLERDYAQWAPVKSVSEYLPRTRERQMVRYCVSVANESQSFFTEGGLVHNCFHFLQSDLPKSLEFIAPFYTDLAPWKHLSQAEPALYNATDNDATIRCYYAMRDWLIRQGRWERFTRHCSDTATILGEMSTAGVLIDVEARSTLQNGLHAEITGVCPGVAEGIEHNTLAKPCMACQNIARPDFIALNTSIQAAIPRELRPIKELKTERTLKELPEDERSDWEPTNVKCECKRLRKSTGRCLLCDGSGVVTHYRKRLPFNWNSTDQCQDLARHYGFTIPKKRGEDREALEAKTLRKFGKRKPVFLDIWNARKRHKLISTYDWVLDSEGRVHTKFGFWPSTWRKASRQPNLMTIPARNELAAAFKRTIIAAPGNVLINADSSAIEAVIMGYTINSPRMVALAKAGIHDWFMSHVRANKEGGVGIDAGLPFELLRKACKEAKAYDASLPSARQLRDAMKRTIHGTDYGLTPFGMADEYPDEFPSVKIATEYQEMLFQLLPELKIGIRNIRERADRQTFLDNHYQYRHYFYAVTKWNSNYQKWDLGTDAKRCIAFGPQSDASAIQTEDLLTLAADPLIRPMLRLIVHDSHVLECPIDMVDYVCGGLHSTMSRPRPELGGLEIGVEIKYGINLQDTQLWVPKPSGN